MSKIKQLLDEENEVWQEVFWKEAERAYYQSQNEEHEKS